MSSSIYNNLFRRNQKIFALLIDPENQNEEKLIRILEVASSIKSGYDPGGGKSDLTTC